MPLEGHPSGALGRGGVEVLAAVPLFEGLSQRQLRKVAERTKVLRYGEGRSIIAEGTMGDSFFVVLDGRARVVRGASGRTIHRLGPGDFFGELAMIDGSPRSASVITVTPSVLARLSRTAFLDVVRAEPNIGIRVMEVLVRRLRELERSAGP
jgi:CRP/FNR family cyclic AMP-dependent transcriptional regulator